MGINPRETDSSEMKRIETLNSVAKRSSKVSLGCGNKEVSVNYHQSNFNMGEGWDIDRSQSAEDKSVMDSKTYLQRQPIQETWHGEEEEKADDSARQVKEKEFRFLVFVFLNIRKDETCLYVEKELIKR